MQGLHTYMSPCPPPPSPSVPTIGLSSMNSLNKLWPAAHRRKDSDELDVFEATRYFSGGADGAGHTGGVGPDGPVGGGGGGGPAMEAEKKGADAQSAGINPKAIKEKKWKQPSSPGARLASFLNSIFHQTASKRKSKASPTTTKTQSLKDSKVGGGFVRTSGRRSSSTINSQSIRSSTGSKHSIYSFGSSGYRTPPPFPDNPRMLHMELNSKRSDGQPRAAAAFCPQSGGWEDQKAAGVPRLAEEAFWSSGHLGNVGRLHGKGFVGVDVACSDGFAGSRWVLNKTSDGFLKSFRMAENDDDDGSSDCSSDLFELKSCDLGRVSTGLHVCGSTDMEAIKRGTAIASVVGF